MNPKFSDRRITAVRDQISDWEIDALLIGNGSNCRWLSGFTGSSAWLLVTEDRAMIGTDSRYWEQAMDQAPKFELFHFKKRDSEELAQFLSHVKAKRIGFESEKVSYGQFRRLKKAAEVDWVPIKRTLEILRETKADEELKAIKEAAAITDRVMGNVNQFIRPGMTEKVLAWKLERELRDNGASGLAFSLIVASGPNGARAHHEPEDRQIMIGDPVVIDMGAAFDGYKSDLTRTFFLGSEPDPLFNQVYSLVLAAQKRTLTRMKIGMTGQEVDSLARAKIEGAGFGQDFGHSLGHGVGLDVHEKPSLSPRSSEDHLKAGSVVTIEPGIYLSGWGGVRIEDLVLMTAAGAEPLSHCPKDPVID